MDYIEALIALSPWLAFAGAALWFWALELRERSRASRRARGAGGPRNASSDDVVVKKVKPADALNTFVKTATEIYAKPENKR